MELEEEIFVECVVSIQEVALWGLLLLPEFTSSVPHKDPRNEDWPQLCDLLGGAGTFQRWGLVEGRSLWVLFKG